MPKYHLRLDHQSCRQNMQVYRYVERGKKGKQTQATSLISCTVDIPQLFRVPPEQPLRKTWFSGAPLQAHFRERTDI
jgi:hypothetical protein